MFKFQTLEVWKKAIRIFPYVIDVADELPAKYQYSLRDNLIRAAVSIPNNISEGRGRRNINETKHFYNIAKSSTYEVVNLSVIIAKKGLMTKEKFSKIYKDAEEISKMLSGLLKK